jgi:isoquinoline 1-oxidoreductase beta subunit
MANIGKIARRTFLVGAAAIAGGLGVGTIAYRREPRNPLLGDLGQGQSTLNPHVLIDADGIMLITPHADLGQGAISVQAALIAEELDLAWGQFRTEPGPPSAAYYNTKVAAEGFPIAATSDSFGARAGRTAGDVVAKLLGLQLTGGSSTVPDSFDKLRVAGAVARQMLLAAAAQQSGVPLAQLKTQDGAVILPDGSRLPYYSLGVAAAKLSPPSGVALKPVEQWRLLGKPMQRLDIVAKSTGTATYGIDLRLPGMVYATVRANPRLGGGIKGFDDSQAKQARGVIKVVALPDGFGVIADNTWRAFQAAALVKPDWGPAPYPATTEALFESVAASFTEAHRDSRLRDDGDVEAALRAAGSGVLQAEYRVPYLAHAPLEPMNATVLLKDGRLDIWTGTQIPRFVVAAAARLTGLDESAIHLHAQISGGSFGRRLEDDCVRQAVRLAQAHPGAPIKMTWTREEDMTHDFPRPLGIARMRGATADGKVTAYDLSLCYPSVTASQLGRLEQPALGPDVAIVAGAWDQPFAIPNYRVSGYRAPPTVPVSSWRSVGASGNGFLHECFLDELISAAGADALAERLRLCTHGPSRRVLQAVGDMAGWGQPLAAGTQGKRGRGLAYTLSFGVPVAEVVEVTATSAGIRIDKVFVACEVGKVIDPVNFQAQVEGGVVWGLGHAIHCELTYADGMPQQTNFHVYQGLGPNQTPRIEVRALQTTAEVRGIGEPPVPPAAPALASAIFATTGQRIRELPLQKHIGFA